MTKYVALYMATREALDQLLKSTPEEFQASMEALGKWGKDNAASIVDLGAPLGKTKRVTASGVSDTKNELTGYTIVQGDSAESAAKIFRSNPYLQTPGTYIELIECMVVPGM